MFKGTIDVIWSYPPLMNVWFLKIPLNLVSNLEQRKYYYFSGDKFRRHWKQKSIVKTITNILLSITRTTIPNLNYFLIKIIKRVLLLWKPLTVFKTMSGFPFSNISWIWIIVGFSRQNPLSRFLSIIHNS